MSMHDENDWQEFWREAGKAIGFVVTVVGLFSLLLMALAVISIVFFGESSPAR